MMVFKTIACLTDWNHFPKKCWYIDPSGIWFQKVQTGFGQVVYLYLSHGPLKGFHNNKFQ